MGFKLLICDFDGTLAATHEDILRGMQRTFEHFGGPVPDERSVLATMGMSLGDAIRSLRGCGDPAEDIEAWVTFYREVYTGDRTVLFPGVKPFLQEARRGNVACVVVSNKGERALRSELKRLDILDDIAALFAGDTVRFKKPDARLYRLEIKPQYPHLADQEVLVIGDTATDLRCLPKLAASPVAGQPTATGSPQSARH
jgi:phosphoglycolate phosphatase